MNCIEGKGVGIDIHCSAKNAALFVDLLLNIFCFIDYYSSKVKLNGIKTVIEIVKI